MTPDHDDEKIWRFYQSWYDQDIVRNPLPLKLSVLQEQRIIHDSTTYNGSIFTPPGLIQRQFNLVSINSNDCDDPEVFSKVIAYLYSTATNPRPHFLIAKFSQVLNELYSRIDELEMDNADLQATLEEIQNALDMGRQKIMRRRDHDLNS